jgi:hypothetical protein
LISAFLVQVFTISLGQASFGVAPPFVLGFLDLGVLVQLLPLLWVQAHSLWAAT